jgi:probable rRNA maturation factor
MISVEFCNEQDVVPFDARRAGRAVEAILRDAGIIDAQVEVAVVDDAAIHALNRRYLEHDYPTDVLSFPLQRDGTRLEGQLVASAETALRVSPQYGWTADDELLLYIIHGALHLVGLDDATPELRDQMRQQERRYLALFGLQPRDDAPPGESLKPRNGPPDASAAAC